MYTNRYCTHGYDKGDEVTFFQTMMCPAHVELGCFTVFTLSGLLLLLSTRYLGVFRLWLHGFTHDNPTWQMWLQKWVKYWHDHLCFYMDVSKNSGFPPQIIHFNGVFHYFHHPFWGVSLFLDAHPHDVGALITHVTANSGLIPRLPSKAQKNARIIRDHITTLLGDCEGTSDGLHNPLSKASFPGRKPWHWGADRLDSHEKIWGWKGSSSNHHRAVKLQKPSKIHMTLLR